MIHSFDEFCDKLIESGFSMGGGNAKGIYAIIPFNWKDAIPGCPVAWHTGDPETDPWEWRMQYYQGSLTVGTVRFLRRWKTFGVKN